MSAQHGCQSCPAQADKPASGHMRRIAALIRVLLRASYASRRSRAPLELRRNCGIMRSQHKKRPMPIRCATRAP